MGMADLERRDSGAVQEEVGRTVDRSADSRQQAAGTPRQRYTIKLRASGFRLVCEAQDRDVLVVVVAVGKREGKAVNRQADQR